MVNVQSPGEVRVALYAGERYMNVDDLALAIDVLALRRRSEGMSDVANEFENLARGILKAAADLNLSG